MANEQIEYIDPDSHFYLFEIPFARCSFGGILYERKSGGFDLYLSMEPSDVEHLDLAKITWLRHQGDSNKETFIDHYEDTKMSKQLMSQAKDRLEDWLHTSLGA
ncbi:MAG: hypothetical protein LAO21_18770 [Acidobacteriia bacterium]|nr:hypothetical protein [Terriglobia bacterium]